MLTNGRISVTHTDNPVRFTFHASSTIQWHALPIRGVGTRLLGSSEASAWRLLDDTRGLPLLRSPSIGRNVGLSKNTTVIALARARAYCGSNAQVPEHLLVSYWQVDSDFAVRLTTSTFDALKKDPAIGRAEALRPAMLAMIEDPSNPWNAYPDYWGPFSIVGDGGGQ